MSDLLNQASLVMVPSGYKEDTVYSVVPTDGSGDLSFTRASNGTRVNSAGLVEVAPWNLLQQSNGFNTTWASGGPGGTVTSGQTDPNGGTSAWLLSKLGQTGRIEQTINVGGVQTFFIYAKKNTSDFILINVYDGTTSHECWFNLSTGVVGTQNASTGAIESVGNGWYKCSVTSTNLFASGIIQLYQSENNGVVTGTTGSIYIFNSQLNIGSTAKPYFPTTDRLNVPRLTYQNGGGGCPSLLLEKQSTNLFSYSEQLDNGFWTPLQITITANNATSPDGTQNADKITEDAVNGVHLFYNTSAVTGSATSTASIFYKKGTRRYFSVKLGIGSNSYTQVFDADGVTTGSNSSNGLTSVSTSIVSMGNGWVRASVTGTDPSASTACYMICSLSNSATPTFDSGNFNPSYLGSTSEYGFFWGAQFEASSYATSYIPTTSSSATRVEDACYKTGISSLIGQTEGVMFCDFNITEIEPDPNYLMVANLSDNSTSNRLGFARVPSGGIHIYVIVSGASQFTFNTTQTTGRFKLAITYKANDYAVYLNGTSIYTNTSAPVPSSMSRFDLGNLLSSFQSKVTMNEAVLFKTRLTNAELASLTTL